MDDVMRGVLGGLAEAHSENQKNLLTQEMDRRKQLAEFWRTKSESPDVRPEARDLATRKYLGIVQTPYGKKLDKSLESLDDWLQVAPVKGGSIPQGPQQQAGPIELPSAPMEFAGGGTGSAGAPAQMPPTTMAPYMLEAPTPPPEYKVSPYFSEQETIQKAQRLAEAQGESQLAIKRRQMPLEIESARAQKQAELDLEGSPENIEKTRLIAEAKRGPVILNQGDLLTDGKGNVIARGNPKDPVIRNVDQQLLDAAAEKVAVKNGLVLDRAKGSLFEQLPPELRNDAAAEHEMMKDTPDQQKIREFETRSRALQLQIAQAQLNKLLDENDPALDDVMAEIVHGNPDAMAQYTGKEREKISAAMVKKGYPVPSGKLPAQLQGQYDQAGMTMRHIDAVEQILAQHPEMVGPIMGRIGKQEESWGAPVFSKKKDPERAALEQELRTRLQYLVAQDLQALIKGRPAFAWLQELKSVSPSVKMNPELLRGSLRALRGSANLVFDQAYFDRYGLERPQPGVPAPTPLPGGVTPGGARPGARPGAPSGPPPGVAAAAVSDVPTTVTPEDIRALANAKRIDYNKAEKIYRDLGMKVIQ